MYTKRVPVLVTLSVLLILTSLAMKDWRPAILILPIASLFFISNNLFSSPEIAVKAQREVTPTRIAIGETSRITLEIFNEGKERISFLEVYDKLPAEVNVVENANHLILYLDPGEKVTVSYEILCPRRGRYYIGPLHLRSKDPLSFRFAENTLAPPAELYVLPDIERLKPTDLGVRQTGPWPGIFHSRRSGIGSEFYGLRHYVPGDELKRIHWKASARMAELITIENVSERSTDIVIVLDTGKGSNLGTPPRTTLEYGVSAAGSLASLLLTLGNRVGLITHGKNRAWLSRDFGKRHLQRVLNQLAAAEPGEAYMPIGYFGEPLFLGPKAQIILISPLLDQKVPNAVRDLAVKGYSTIVISPSFTGLVDHQTDEATETAYRILALERRNLMMELRRYATVIDWNPNLPLRTVLKEVRKWRMPIRHLRTMY
jgi:uncharacterized protein (DUF58 family)